MSLLLALDQGTSSSRAIVFDRDGNPLAVAQRELTQHYPRAGWVEHDPVEIWQSQLATAREALAALGARAGEVRAIGITNQRETTVVWDRRSGVPLCRAIVWQDRRTEAMCDEIRAAGLAAMIGARTGLVVDAYFSATKLAWILEHVGGARERAMRGELAFGTVDSWLLWNLTGGRVHATDVTNASRTMLYDIHEDRWSPALLEAFGVPGSMLPAVRASSGIFGETAPGLFDTSLPIAGIAGDQQAALFGQACFRPGLSKNTYGTGCFMLMNTGTEARQSASGLVTTASARVGAVPGYALEGSVFIGGAVVQWLRDGLRAIRASSEVQALAESVPDAGGVLFVPAFAGLGAPYWNASARGTIVGLTRGTTVAHIARAALESIAFQSAALLEAMGRDALAAGGSAVSELRVDGGACVNDLLMQFQADIAGVPVVRPAVVETTALGAAYLAGLGIGVYRSIDELAAQWRAERRFLPTMSRDRASELMAGWERAVRQACTN